MFLCTSFFISRRSRNRIKMMFLSCCYSSKIKSNGLSIQEEDLTKPRETWIFCTVLTCKAHQLWCNKICKHICCFWHSCLWQQRESHFFTLEKVFSLDFFFFKIATITSPPNTNYDNAFCHRISGNATKPGQTKWNERRVKCYQRFKIQRKKTAHCVFCWVDPLLHAWTPSRIWIPRITVQSLAKTRGRERKILRHITVSHPAERSLSTA